MKFPRLGLLAVALAAAFPWTSAPAAQAPDKFAAIPAAMQAFVDRGEIAGAVTLVATKDKVLHLAAVGKSDLETGRKMETNDLFWIASMTKPMSAVAVAMLVEEGRIRFDDLVEKYVPELHAPWVLEEQTAERRVLVPAARPVTVRDLLTHTSGMGEYGAYGPHWTLAEMIREAAREPLRFQPGTKWAYSTAGIDTLCRIVEVASGRPFAEFMQSRLFGPLGMKDSSFWMATENMPRFATNYRRDEKTGRLVPVKIHYMYGGDVTDRQRPPLGGAGLFSTAGDVAKFYQMLLNGGVGNGQRFLKPETIAELTHPQTEGLKAGFLPGSAWGYGFCLVAEPQGATAALSPGTFGHGGAHGTQSWADPRRGAIFIMMIQRAGLPNSDGSDLRVAFQAAATAALDR